MGEIYKKEDKLNKQECFEPGCDKNADGFISRGLDLLREYYCSEHGTNYIKEELKNLTNNQIVIIGRIINEQPYNDLPTESPEFIRFVENNAFWLKRVFNGTTEST